MSCEAKQLGKRVILKKMQTFHLGRKRGWQTKQQTLWFSHGVLYPSALREDSVAQKPSEAQRSSSAVTLGGPGFTTGEPCRSATAQASTS